MSRPPLRIAYLVQQFVPEVGAAVIRFEDSRYGPDAIRIWNLPGQFVTKAEAND